VLRLLGEPRAGPGTQQRWGRPGAASQRSLTVNNGNERTVEPTAPQPYWPSLGSLVRIWHARGQGFDRPCRARPGDWSLVVEGRAPQASATRRDRNPRCSRDCSRGSTGRNGVKVGRGTHAWSPDRSQLRPAPSSSGRVGGPDRLLRAGRPDFLYEVDRFGRVINRYIYLCDLHEWLILLIWEAIDGGYMMDTSASSTLPRDEFDATGTRPVGGPVPVAWREGTLTRAKELEALCAWVLANHHPPQNCEALKNAIRRHLQAARQAAEAADLDPKKPFRVRRSGPLLERAMSNLDAAEAHILNLASPGYLYGQLPCLLRQVQCHLLPTDPGRLEFERVARKVGVKDPDHPLLQNKEPPLPEKLQIVDEERGKIVTTVRAASSAKLREQVRVRSFRNVLVLTAIFMTLLAIGVALLGLNRRTLIPLCFAPEESGRAVVVCPTAQSDSFIPSQQSAGATPQPGVPVEDIDKVVEETAKPQDLLIVELVGLTAAAVASAAAIRRIKGSSERYGIPVALAALKLPTGAITAFLGLLLMRGQFVPGLSALDTSAQILAWALVFGYAQQLFTRLVDQQGQTVLDTVRGADKAQPTPTPP
jgi:hypothetical protein